MVVELGYLTQESHLVVTDTLGHKVLFRAYRIDEVQKTFELFGKKRPMEALGEVTVTGYLHRGGWSTNGELILARSRARLYRTKTSHILVGRNWKSILCIHERDDPQVYGPYFSNLKPEPLDLARDRPFFALLPDISVRGQRQFGTTVELFGLERKEFLDFVIGKLRIVFEFEASDKAAAFAANFLGAQDPKVLDASTAVDIDRSPEIVMPQPTPGKLQNMSPSFYRRELIDLRTKWPMLAWDRWAKHVQAHAAAFASSLKQMEVASNPENVDLDALDRFLRGLPSNTVFAAFVMDAAAYVGKGFLAALGVRARHRWTTVKVEPPQLGHVLYFDEVNTYVSPVAWICKIWENHVPATLHANVAQWTYEVRGMLAFRHRIEFTALGFVSSTGDGFKAFKDRVSESARQVAATSQVLGETHMEIRILPFGVFEVYYVTGEVIEPTGSRYLPVMAVPFTSHTQAWTGVLDGTSPRCPTREDVAILRLQGNDLVPLGVQLANYPEIGPSFAKRQGLLTLRAIAVADKGQVLTPRVRQARPEFKDLLAPIDGEEMGVPLRPYANLLGLIETVDETVNPITNLSLWKLHLNVSGFRCEVLVRKDRCDGIPAVGNHFTGLVWLAAKIEPEAVSTDSYIR